LKRAQGHRIVGNTFPETENASGMVESRPEILVDIEYTVETQAINCAEVRIACESGC